MEIGLRMASQARKFAGYSVRLLWLFCLASLCSVFGFGQHYPMLAVPNSPHGIYVMMQDSRSRIWLGTIDDVYCFDGVNFYSIQQYGYPKETANAFAEDSDGGIWIATQGTDAGGGTGRGGLYRFATGRVDKMLSGDGLSVVGVSPGLMLAAMATEMTGRPAYGDLYRLKENDGRWSAERLLEKSADHMTIDHQGGVLFPCPGGWCELKHDQIVNWRGGDASQFMQRHTGDPLAEKVLRDSAGCVWTRSEVRASYQCAGDSSPNFLPYNLSQNDSSAHLEEGPDGSVFMLQPLLFGRPGHFQFVHSNGLPPAMDSALIASDGTIWLGTDNGLFRFPYPFRIESWSQSEGLTNPWELLRRIGNHIYSTAGDLVVLSADRQKWVPVPGTSGFGQIHDIAGLADRRILATADGGIAVYEQDSGKLLLRSAAGTGAGHRLAETSDGQLWLGANGINSVHLQGNRIFLAPEAVLQDPISDMRYDAARHSLGLRRQEASLSQGRQMASDFTEGRLARCGLLGYRRRAGWQHMVGLQQCSLCVDHELG
jgi:hypothetical protein